MADIDVAESRGGEEAHGAVDLTCYVYPDWAPLIRPARRERAWMDAAPERFAYRCLPLAIANAHGWELLSPCGFAARWTGGEGVDAVEIVPDPGTEPRRATVSLFGLGTITFHVEALFRTSPGWNLWVGGPANAAKDAIAPLAGVIETDWSPYSFTMNWRFTRRGQWVRFEAGEPIAVFFPVERGVLDRLEPTIRPIDEAPELRAAFEAWSRSRDAFQADVAANPPRTPTDAWQKLYYRGLMPDGAAGAGDHQTRQRIAQFSAAPAPSEVPCPIAHPRAPAAAPVPAGDPAAALALRRRDWMLRTIERQRLLAPGAGSVPRVRAPSSAEFLRHFYAASRPVVIEGAIENWPAMRRWTATYLAERVGDAEVEYQGGRSGDPEFELHKDRHARRMPFRRFIEAVTQPGAGNDAYVTAYNSAANTAALAPLMEDLGRLDRYLTDDAGMLWIGPAGTFTPIHFDLTNNLLVQVTGAKRLHLFPPAEAGRLAHRRHVFSDVHDIEDEDRLARFPEAREAQRFEVVLGPGDCLFIPVGWFHQVRSLSFSTMLTYTNFLWANDAWRDFPEDE